MSLAFHGKFGNSIKLYLDVNSGFSDSLTLSLPIWIGKNVFQAKSNWQWII